MKIVSWNCHYGLNKDKFKELVNNPDFADADIYAFQEVLENEFLDIADFEKASEYKYRHWYGDHQEYGDCHKPRGAEGDLGIALISKKYKIHRFDQGLIRFRYVVPYLMLEDDKEKFILIHVWTKGKPDGYIEPIYKALNFYKNQFDEKNLPIVMAGDFNFGVEFRDSFFADKFDKKLAEYNISKNDAKIRENKGTQTFSYPRYADKKYFNDCVYTKNCEVKNFKIGDKVKWIDKLRLSDHCPIMAELELNK